MTYQCKDDTESVDRPATEITEADIERGAELLRRWLEADPVPTAPSLLKELVAEVIVRVSPQLERTKFRTLLRHDRSLYRAPEL